MSARAKGWALVGALLLLALLLVGVLTWRGVIKPPPPTATPTTWQPPQVQPRFTPTPTSGWWAEPPVWLTPTATPSPTSTEEK